jgi:hypothetical protein
LISWETSLHFGRESTDEIAKYIQDSLANTLGSSEEFLVAAKEILLQAEPNSNSLILFALPSEQLLENDQLGNDIAILLKNRFSHDEPTILAVTNPNSQNPIIWDHIASVEKDDTKFREKFIKRNSFLITIPIISDALVIFLEPTKNGGFNIMSSAFAFPVSTSLKRDYAGIRSEIDRGFGRMVLERFYALIQEPTDSYSHSVLNAVDVLSGKYIGLAVTRSIITSQLIQSAAASQKLVDKDTYWIQIISPDNPNLYTQFFYSSNCFCPPLSLSSNKNHSGSVIASALMNDKIQIAGKKVWEVGCGPGYVTLQLAKKVGENGIVLATDKDVHAVTIAEKNIKNTGYESRVNFLTGDCTSFSFKMDSDSNHVILVTPEGMEYQIDIIFIELPLLPYWGGRLLSRAEEGYMEAVPEKYEYILPPTITKLLLNISSNKLNEMLIVLPIAGGQSDIEQIKTEINNYMGMTCSIDALDEYNQSFITPLLIRIKNI